MRIIDWSSDVCYSDLRDPQLHLAGSVLDAGPAAARAGIVDDGATATARRARRREREEALVVGHDPSATAARALPGARAGLGARSRAGVARGVACEVHGGGDALHRVDEGEVELGFEVLAPVGTSGAAVAATATAAPEEAAEDVADRKSTRLNSSH